MVSTADKDVAARTPLSRRRVLDAAVALADEGGIEALTMRGLAKNLDVEAMSLYYHVANKEALLDGVAERVIEEVLAENEGLALPDGPSDWIPAMTARIQGARRVMLRHRWAPAVLESRTSMSAAVLLHFHDILGVMKAAGFSYDLIHHAMHALGSRAIGFTQEMFEPAPGSADENTTAELFATMADRLPLLIGMLEEIAHDDPDSTIGWCDDQSEFEFGLDLILNGLDRLRMEETRP